MGKRIAKSKKHKKLKFVDPCYKETFPRSKKKILPNEPPREDDYQEVSRRTEEIIKLKNQAKANKLKKRKKKKPEMKDDFIIVKTPIDHSDSQGAKKISRPLPSVIKQNKSESEERFFNRLQRMANAAIAEAKIETKYNIELVNIDNQGNAQYVPAEKEISERKKEKRKKYHEKEVEKKKMKMEESQFDFKREKINFGETVMAPPVFTAKPRKAVATDNKPGKKELLLKNKLENKKNTSENPTPLSTKWKCMPAEKRKVIELERLRAVQMYRQLKNKKTIT